MGVQGLWSLVGPAARPTQLESLRQKKIAVDASIWIHQFMRTMRDKEGNALRNGHLMGFFRRLCKLLFFDIKPVFVFDGGAPSIKRATIRERRKRREGVQVNLRATARKILSAQVKSRVLFEQQKRLNAGDSVDENFIYAEELEKAAQVLRKVRKTDQFELPEIAAVDTNLNMVDPRLATQEELQDFVDEFTPADLDIDSESFHALPPEVKYEIIQDLKNKSRQTSWARLDEMVRGSKTALDFSKHQIRLLKHRNTMTQTLMQMNTMASGGFEAEPARIAGERGRQYILYKNENLDEGLGWKLPGLSAATPIVVDSSTGSHPEPKLEVPAESIKQEESEDKVQAAIANNPKLAAMFSELLSDEEEEELEEAQELDKQMIMNDAREYLYEEDDEAINQAISKMYQNDNQEPALEENNKEDALLTLNADDFLDVWISRMPDAFLYLHSFNDQHKRILSTAMKAPVDQLQQELRSVHKQFGKTTERDELALESLQFHESFLESVIKWKEINLISQEEEFEEVTPVDEPTLPLIVDDDDEEQDIQFIPTIKENKVEEDVQLRDIVSKKTDNEFVVVADDDEDQDIQFIDHPTFQKSNRSTVITTNSQEPVHIDIHQSTLQINKDTISPTKTTIPTGTKQNESINEERTVENMQVNQETEVIDRGYNSEDELDTTTQGEDDEFARFMSDIASRDLDDVRSDLVRDMKDLHEVQRKEMGNSDTVTDEMIKDIQELLKLFGVPYIVSPMEAEAQCAELEELKLVDGIITDDSDVFLFGASKVYKNMFNQQRFVECYLSQDIEKEMALSREKLIQLAFLLGSDYTDGIPGVGPVAAMELLEEFSTEEQDTLEAPLVQFRDWYNSGIDTTPFQRKFRKKFKDMDIPDEFPNPLVINAYYHPAVDNSTQTFEWGQPQLDSLREFLQEAFGWPESKADEVLLPVLREMNNRKAHGDQQVIGNYFNVTGTVSAKGTHKHSSKRVQNIVERWRKQKKPRSK